MRLVILLRQWYSHFLNRPLERYATSIQLLNWLLLFIFHRLRLENLNLSQGKLHSFHLLRARAKHQRLPRLFSLLRKTNRFFNPSFESLFEVLDTNLLRLLYFFLWRRLIILNLALSLLTNLFWVMSLHLSSLVSVGYHLYSLYMLLAFLKLHQFFS